MLRIEPELEGNCSLGPEGVTVLCETNLDNTMVTLNYSCSYNEGPPQDCEYLFIILLYYLWKFHILLFSY